MYRMYLNQIGNKEIFRVSRNKYGSLSSQFSIIELVALNGNVIPSLNSAKLNLILSDAAVIMLRFSFVSLIRLKMRWDLI